MYKLNNEIKADCHIYSGRPREMRRQYGIECGYCRIDDKSFGGIIIKFIAYGLSQVDHCVKEILNVISKSRLEPREHGLVKHLFTQTAKSLNSLLTFDKSNKRESMGIENCFWTSRAKT